MTKMMQVTRGAATAAIGVVLAAMSACTTIGSGSGDLSGGPTKSAGPVSFSWKATSASTDGEMNATLADGRQFSGPFVQMTRERVLQLDPMWIGAPYGWRDWSGSTFGPDAGVQTIYGGKVEANLKGPGSDRMRCSFTLNDPSAGMVGGGQGQCQLGDGGTVDAVFPRT
jgi:hypothetical protein